MKKFASFLITTILVAAPAFAGNPVTPPPVTVSPPTAAADWTGFYGGLMASSANGRITASNTAADDLSGNVVSGAFAGYNMQRGRMVYGAELALSFDAHEFGFFTSTIENQVDAKVRVGYTFGKAMVYGVVGYSTMDLVDPDIAPLAGFNMGVGVDMMLGDKFFVGAEYLVRSVSGAFAPPSLIRFDDQLVSTISLRVGMRF